MKFYIHKLGCPKNDVDADYIAARLISDGHQPVKSAETADSVLVNTCGFIVAAKEESINSILAFGQMKKRGRIKSLYATGCLTQRYGDEMLKEIPELNGTFGHGALDSIADAVGKSSQLKKVVKMETRKLGYLSWKNRFISDNLPYAYLKISDGCDRACTYCAIPGMRGKFRSRPVESIIDEAKFLADNGKREIILVSQEATMYGYESRDKTNILHLLKELEKIEGIKWIRLLYLHPTAVTTDLVEHMADKSNKTLNYYDLPLQHINSDILSNMRRQVDRKTIENLLDKIQETSDDAVIRTTFIVGFPGETKKQFNELAAFVDRQKFDRMGVFPYSKEEDTAAEKFEKQISEKVKTARMDDLMNIQREIAFDNNESLLSIETEVIIDMVPQKSEAVGRTKGDCPEIDQEVFVSGENIKIGDICRVKINSSDGYDLRASLVEII